MADMACCGCICDGCKDYHNACKGCNAENGKVYWTAYMSIEQCPIYTCCRETKAYQNCGECDQLPCGIFYACKDPSMTDEAHEATVQERVKILKG